MQGPPLGNRRADPIRVPPAPRPQRRRHQSLGRGLRRQWRHRRRGRGSTGAELGGPHVAQVS